MTEENKLTIISLNDIENGKNLFSGYDIKKVQEEINKQVDNWIKFHYDYKIIDEKNWEYNKTNVEANFTFTNEKKICIYNNNLYAIYEEDDIKQDQYNIGQTVILKQMILNPEADWNWIKSKILDYYQKEKGKRLLQITYQLMKHHSALKNKCFNNGIFINNCYDHVFFKLKRYNMGISDTPHDIKMQIKDGRSVLVKELTNTFWLNYDEENKNLLNIIFKEPLILPLRKDEYAISFANCEIRGTDKSENEINRTGSFLFRDSSRIKYDVSEKNMIIYLYEISYDNDCNNEINMDFRKMFEGLTINNKNTKLINFSIANRKKRKLIPSEIINNKKVDIEKPVFINNDFTSNKNDIIDQKINSLNYLILAKIKNESNDEIYHIGFSEDIPYNFFDILFSFNPLAFKKNIDKKFLIDDLFEVLFSSGIISPIDNHSINTFQCFDEQQLLGIALQHLSREVNSEI